MSTEPDIPWFRELYEAILKYQGSTPFASVLQPWIGKARIAVSEMDGFRRPDGSDRQSGEFLLRIWNLYALSRVNDFLLLPFQNDARGRWDGPQVTSDEYIQFFTDIGFTTSDAVQFSPFHHEIVSVRQASYQEEPIAIEQRCWPCLMFGNMLFSRSGVRIVAGSRHAVRSVAEQSTLYSTAPSPYARPVSGMGQQLTVENIVSAGLRVW